VFGRQFYFHLVNAYAFPCVLVLEGGCRWSVLTGAADGFKQTEGRREGPCSCELHFTSPRPPLTALFPWKESLSLTRVPVDTRSDFTPLPLVVAGLPISFVEPKASPVPPQQRKNR
jgi:hypothetical protein